MANLAILSGIHNPTKKEKHFNKLDPVDYGISAMVDEEIHSGKQPNANCKIHEIYDQ